MICRSSICRSTQNLSRSTGPVSPGIKTKHTSNLSSEMLGSSWAMVSWTLSRSSLRAPMSSLSLNLRTTSRLSWSKHSLHASEKFAAFSVAISMSVAQVVMTFSVALSPRKVELAWRLYLAKLSLFWPLPLQVESFLPLPRPEDVFLTDFCGEKFSAMCA